MIAGRHQLERINRARGGALRTGQGARLARGPVRRLRLAHDDLPVRLRACVCVSSPGGPVHVLHLQFDGARL